MVYPQTIYPQTIYPQISADKNPQITLRKFMAGKKL